MHFRAWACLLRSFAKGLGKAHINDHNVYVLQSLLLHFRVPAIANCRNLLDPQLAKARDVLETLFLGTPRLSTNRLEVF